MFENLKDHIVKLVNSGLYKNSLKFYVPKEYLYQSRKKADDLKYKNKSLNKDITLLNSQVKNLKKAQVQIQEKSSNKLSVQKLKTWSKKVRSRNICDVCKLTQDDLESVNGSIFTAHHLWSKKTHLSLAYEYHNGVCLCHECHNEYHKKYDITNCNPFTYSEFKMDQQNRTKVEQLEKEVNKLKNNPLLRLFGAK